MKTVCQKKDLGLELAEKEWMTQVVDLAKRLGWEVYHPWISIRSERGWPDLALWRERLVLAELKTDDEKRSKLSDAQERVIAGLLAARVEVYVWRPRDLTKVAKILSSRGRWEDLKGGKQ